MKLLTAEPISVSAGIHNVQIVISTGTAKLQYSTDSLTFVDIPDSDVAASSGFEVSLPSCQVQAVLTGDAELAMNQVARLC